jgi:hypothetical protein
MPQYAYFDHTAPAPQSVLGWYDTDAIDYPSLPASDDLLLITSEQFAARFPNPSGWMIQSGALVPYVAPTPPPPTIQQQAGALLFEPVSLVCTSIPSLNGNYPIDPTTQTQITGIASAINAGLGLPGEGDTFNWPDATGTPHAWPAVQFTAFAKGVMNYVYQAAQVAQGHGDTLPTQPLTIA